MPTQDIRCLKIMYVSSYSFLLLFSLLGYPGNNSLLRYLISSHTAKLRVVQGNDEMRLCAIPAHMLSASHSENADHRNRKPEHYDRVNQPYPNNITALKPSNAKTPAEARVSNLWCPNPESNQGHGDFQSPALPTELFGQRGALNLKQTPASNAFHKNEIN